MKDTDVTITLPVAGWNVIGSALGQMPYVQVSSLINEINRQIAEDSRRKAVDVPHGQEVNQATNG